MVNCITDHWVEGSNPDSDQKKVSHIMTSFSICWPIDPVLIIINAQFLMEKSNTVKPVFKGHINIKGNVSIHDRCPFIPGNLTWGRS